MSHIVSIELPDTNVVYFQTDVQLINPFKDLWIGICLPPGGLSHDKYSNHSLKSPEFFKLEIAAI